MRKTKILFIMISAMLVVGASTVPIKADATAGKWYCEKFWYNGQWLLECCDIEGNDCSVVIPPPPPREP